MANLRWMMLTAVTSLLAVSGCGNSDSGTTGLTDEPSASATASAMPSATSPSASMTRRGPQPVEFRFFVENNAPGEEGPPQARYDVLTDGGTRIRLKLSMYADPGTVSEEYLYTWDGKRILLYSLSNEVPYTVYEAPNEHPDELQ